MLFWVSVEVSVFKVMGTFLGSAFRAVLPNSLAIFLGCIAVIFVAPHIGLNYTQMNLVMYLIVEIDSFAGEYLNICILF